MYYNELDDEPLFFLIYGKLSNIPLYEYSYKGNKIMYVDGYGRVNISKSAILRLSTSDKVKVMTELMQEDIT